MVKRQRAGNVRNIIDGRNRFPKPEVLLRRAEAVYELLPSRTPELSFTFRRRPWYSSSPFVDHVIIRPDYPCPDYSGFDVFGNNHRSQSQMAAHRMPPHADFYRIYSL